MTSKQITCLILLKRSAISGIKRKCPLTSATVRINRDHHSQKERAMIEQAGRIQGTGASSLYIGSYPILEQPLSAQCRVRRIFLEEREAKVMGVAKEEWGIGAFFSPLR
jgi:hypothetical protein